MGTLYNFEKEVKAISRDLASSLNRVILGYVDKRMLRHRLENIQSDFLYACTYFALAHSSTVKMLKKTNLPFETQETVYYLGFAYFRIVNIFLQYNSVVDKYAETKDRKALLTDLRDIRKQVRSIYL